MKNVANIISISRIILLFGLFFTFNNIIVFISIYLICGFTDILDGYIARKTNTQSVLGSKLDSFADLILFLVITTSIIIYLGEKILVFIPGVIITFVIRIMNMGVVAYKYHCFGILHTWGNKLTGLLLFTAPLFIMFNKIQLLWIIVLVAVLSSIEELIIHLTSSKLELDRKSIFKQ